MKFGDIIHQIETECTIKADDSKETQEYIENYYKRLDELFLEASRLYGKKND